MGRSTSSPLSPLTSQPIINSPGLVNGSKLTSCFSLTSQLRINSSGSVMSGHPIGQLNVIKRSVTKWAFDQKFWSSDHRDSSIKRIHSPDLIKIESPHQMTVFPPMFNFNMNACWLFNSFYLCLNVAEMKCCAMEFEKIYFLEWKIWIASFMCLEFGKLSSNDDEKHSTEYFFPRHSFKTKISTSR